MDSNESGRANLGESLCALATFQANLEVIAIVAPNFDEYHLPKPYDLFQVELNNVALLRNREDSVQEH
jgi:hypothetical protein